MERVQFQQEQMLAELKDLVEKNLFTIQETKMIIKKRTEFERALVRRVAKKADFLRYVQYEMGLEQLRQKRVERMKLPPSPPTISDYALVRRKFQIFERALKKFKSDVALWIEYIQEAKREGARTLVGRITARALQLHPNVPSLYILAASHELEHFSPTSARTLLQRGIRLNKDSIDLWREYVRMELGFIESLRRRWDVLGISSDDSIQGEYKGKAKAVDAALDIHMDGGGEPAALERKKDDLGDGAGEDGAAVRKDIMQGAIVKSVVSSAITAVPRYELFEALYTLIQEHPSPASLRHGLLEFLDDLLKTTLPDHPKALRLLVRRLISREAKGEELVDGIKITNELLMKKASDTTQEDVLQVYSDFVVEWCQSEIDANLKEYLIKSLEILVHRNKKSPSLLSGHFRALIQSRLKETDRQDCIEGAKVHDTDT